MIWKRLRLTLEMIKFEHSVFALPFALTGALLAWREGGWAGASVPGKLFWIVVAMVCARSAAMAFNRLIDADIDGRNPRTKARHLPAGLLSQGFAWAFVAVASALFLLASGELNRLCLRLCMLVDRATLLDHRSHISDRHAQLDPTRHALGHLNLVKVPRGIVIDRRPP